MDRNAAYRVIRATDRGRRLDLAFEQETSDLDRRQRAWVQELTYGTTRLRGRLDHLLHQHVDRGLHRVKKPVITVLRLGAYQLLYMGSVPDYAAVSQSVDLARKVGGNGAASLVNAVLRALSRTGADPSLFPDFDRDPVGWLSTWGSHPRWMIERWLVRWSAVEVRRLVEANNEVPPLTLVLLDGDVESAVDRLAEAGLAGRELPSQSPIIALAPGTDPAAALDVIPNAMIQDPGAALVVPFIGAVDTRALDLCAAPGGKALALSSRGAEVVACDRSKGRLQTVRSNASRVGAAVSTVVARAERPPFKPQPLVLVDAPCTGTGTLRRNPDARWRLTPQDVAALSSVQADILAGAAEVVSSGGRLVYSTCSLEVEENAEQVEHFLRRHPGFRLEASDAIDEQYLDAEGRLDVVPHRHACDGAFAAIMRAGG